MAAHTVTLSKRAYVPTLKINQDTQINKLFIYIKIITKYIFWYFTNIKFMRMLKVKGHIWYMTKMYDGAIQQESNCSAWFSKDL